MLSILFVGTRMRALQLTKATDGTIPPTAGPLGWAQDGMFLSTWSCLVQVIMALVVPLLTGAKPEMDEDGNLKTPEGAGKIMGIICDLIKYLCLIAMYGGVVTVCYAVYTMTPETLPPSQSEPLSSLVHQFQIHLHHPHQASEKKVSE